MDVAVIILNWNAAEDTIRCVQEVSGWKQLRPVLFVVDNASSDDSVAQIAANCPSIHLICNPINLGFAGGCNKAIVEALKLDDLPILLLNNDATMAEADGVRLLETLGQHNSVGFVVPLLYDAGQPERLISAGGKDPVKHIHTRIRELPAGDLSAVEFVSGTVLLVRAEVFRRVGLFDEDYFFSTEVADLCMRAKKMGICCLVDGHARAWHTVSRSASLRDTLYVYYVIRNRFVFLRKCGYRLRWLIYFFWFCYSAALALKLVISGNRATAQATKMGLFDGLQGRFGDQNERVLRACAVHARTG